MNKYVQDFLPGFLEAEAEVRESMITEYERQLHLAKQFCRYEKQQKLCNSDFMKNVLEKAKRDIIKLMERC